MTGVQTCALPICFPVTIYTLVSFVVNVITSFASTFVIAAKVLVTAPVVIVAVDTPLVLPAIIFTFTALVVYVMLVEDSIFKH